MLKDKAGPLHRSNSRRPGDEHTFVQGLGLKVRCRSVVGGRRLQLDCGERVGAPVFPEWESGEKREET